MLNLNDFEAIIRYYILSIGLDPEGWDIRSAAIRMRNEFPYAESIDDVSYRRFLEIIVSYDPRNHEPEI